MACALAALVACFVLPIAAGAHPTYLRSEPAANAVLQNAPQTVSITFTEPVESRFFDVSVVSEAGERVDRGDAQVAENGRQIQAGLNTIGQGGYVVRWRALGYDGHVVDGAFAFGVGRPASALANSFPSASPAPDAAIRWITLVALAGLVGSIGWRVLVVASLASEPRSPSIEPLEARALGLAWAAFSVFLIASVAALGLQVTAVGRGGLDLTRLGEVLFASRFGQLWMARVILLSTLGAALAHVDVEEPEVPTRRSKLARRSVTPQDSDPRERWWRIALGVGVAMLLTVALSGHAAVTDPVALSVAVDWLHVAAATVWIGGLLQLGLLAGTRTVERGELVRCARKFGPVALASAGVLGATGVYSAWAQIPSPAQIADSAYGDALLIKLLVIVPLLILGAINLGSWVPRRWQPTLQPRRTFILAEALVGVAVLAGAGILTSLPPARSVGAAAPLASVPPVPVVGTPALSLSTNVGDDLVTLSLDPASPGIAQLALVIQDSTGAPVQGAVATVTYAVENAGTSTVELSRTGPGKFAGNVSAAAGRTTATVILASPDQPPAAATFAFDMPVRGARDILARAEAAMNGLQSLREHQSLEGLPGETLVAEYAYLAPLEMQVVSNDGEVIAVGTQRFERRGATWTVGAWPDPAGFRWPAFSFGQAEDDVSLLGIEMLGGQPAFRVTFADRQQVRYSLWIDTASFYVLQEEIMAPGHYERATFSDFDAPLTIELPDVPVVGS